ncbi:hypothetical protein KY308_01880 [Candidatus Woesearchaeota archaeon]|nr:hypothetical protein [Candidatus Woesearchaeota archaeon]
MPNTLDDVVKLCREKYTLKVDRGNTKKYNAFLVRQQERHGYNIQAEKNGQFVFLNLLADKLFMFSVLIRQTPISDEYGNIHLVDTDDKLVLLRAKGTSGYLWDDKRLFTIYQRLDRARASEVRYLPLIDEIGRDPEVAKIWGRNLNYNDDIGKSRKKRLTS